MSVEVIPPAIGIEAWLRESIERNLDCLFTVAYLSDAGVEAIEAAVRKRAKRARFSLRVLFQDNDLVTEPDALDRLRRCARGRAGSITLKRAADPNFHAKAYGFKRSRSAPSGSVIFGSANLTKKAISIHSAELDVSVAPSGLASQLLTAMEEFWDEGEDVGGALVQGVSARVREKKSALEAAAKVQRGWSRSGRRRRPRGGASAGRPLWIEHVVKRHRTVPGVSRAEVGGGVAMQRTAEEFVHQLADGRWFVGDFEGADVYMLTDGRLVLRQDIARPAAA